MISTEDQISKALFMAGVMIGSYSFGWLSDRAGRKPAFFVAVVIQVNLEATSETPATKLIHNVFDKKRSAKNWPVGWVGAGQMNVFQALVGPLSGLIHNYWAFVLLRSTFNPY